jgi:signal transduction histidine kinase
VRRFGLELLRRARQLLFTEDTDLGVVQGAFAVLFTLDLALRDAGGSAVELASFPVAGLAVVAVGGLLAVALPWRRLPSWAIGALPVLDLAALGLSRMDVNGGGAGVLAVVPALWLGRQFGRRGAVVSVVGATFLLAVPSLSYLGFAGVNVSRAVLIPVTAGWAALVISSALARLRASRDAAEQGRRELEAILDTVDVGLVLLGADGTYRAMNRRHEAFMRISYPEGHDGRAGQLGAVYAEDGVTPLGRDEMPSWRASLGEEFDGLLLWIGTDVLTNRALSVSARTVRGEDGEFAGAALAYHDVTDFVRALRVKGEFVASVSHELRTPLTSIGGYVNILRERDDLPPEVVSQLEVVERNTGRLSRLVADLLHTARSDEGPMHVVRHRTDLGEIVRDCVEAARPQAARGGVHLELEGPESLVILADRERMAQVVDNLVSNAVKYSHPGGRVRVSLGIDGNRAELSVSDTGIGIAAADRDRLFTRFFRTRQAEERSIQGVGLGLSITKSIVESHGGRIEVESELGRGSAFRVRLPLGS